MQHNTTQPPSAAKMYTLLICGPWTVQHYPWVGGGRDAQKRWSLNYTIKDLCQRSHQRSFI